MFSTIKVGLTAAAIILSVISGAYVNAQVNTAQLREEPTSANSTIADALYTPCAEEDSTNCFWESTARGNGSGSSFVNIAGVQYANVSVNREPITVTKTVEVPVTVEKIVNVPVEVEKIVTKEVKVPVEVVKTVTVNVPTKDQGAEDYARQQGFESGAASIQRGVDDALNTPCANEDSSDCYWNAATMGNGTGTSFVNLGGNIYPLN